MKKWTIKELGQTDDLLFAAAILNERTESLNPYSPLADKLRQAKNKIMEIRAEKLITENRERKGDGPEI